MRRPMHSFACCVVIASLVGVGCGGSFDPRPVNQVAFLERAITQEKGSIRVRAAVPSKRETKKLFDDNLYRRRVQPVWLEIENKRDEAAMFLPVGLDPAYFTPAEVANFDLKSAEDGLDFERTQYFFDSSLNMWLEPGQTRSGFVFTNLDEGTKSFNIDITTNTEVLRFTFFVPVPGLKIDHYEVDWETLHPADEIIELDEETLIEAIAKEPCCATDKKAKGTADPLNLVVIGTPADIYYSFLRAGWDETEVVSRSSLLKMGWSFVTGGEYRYSPVSSLFVFGRKQDIAFQKARDNIHERNHLRLWLAPMRFQGKPVWIGQISRDIGVRFTPKTITTHKIDPNVDETREYLLENLAYAQSLKAFGYADGVGAAPEDAPRGNLTGDPYFTDGHRLVLWLSEQPVDIADLEFVEWSIPPHGVAPSPEAAPND
jgi:hypothetical protein